MTPNSDSTGLDLGRGDSTGIALTVDFLGGTDVVGFTFEVRPIACAEDPQGGVIAPPPPARALNDVDPIRTVTIDLEDLTLGDLENPPPGVEFDPESSHLFADHFFFLAEGCYHITARPVRSLIYPADINDPSSILPSDDCLPSWGHGLVMGGNTEEISLISQCRGDHRGGIDLSTSINHAPTITNVSFERSRYVYECEANVVCATAVDRDGDSMIMYWTQLEGPERYSLKVTSDIEVPLASGNGTARTQCVEIVNQNYGDYKFMVKVYDTLVHQGRIIPVEDYLREVMNPPLPSNHYVIFPLQTAMLTESRCIDEWGQLQPLPGMEDMRLMEGCQPMDPSIYYCSRDYWDDVSITCPAGRFAPERVYPACR